MTEVDSISDDDSIGVFGRHLIAMVMVECGSKMTAFHGMEVPGLADECFMMY